MSELSDVGRTFLLLVLIASLGACFVRAFREFERIRDRRLRHVAAVFKRWILPVGLFVVGLFGLVTWPAPARDLDGRYKNSPLHDWFEHLASGKGRCCSDADGHTVEEADWETKDGHYRVRVPKAPDSKDTIWVEVPDAAVITEPNKAARTMVWPVYDIVQGFSDSEGYSIVSIRCFMPGSMT
jgi:hypothetical protein